MNGNLAIVQKYLDRVANLDIQGAFTLVADDAICALRRKLARRVVADLRIELLGYDCGSGFRKGATLRPGPVPGW